MIDQINELPEDGLKSLPETLHFTENKWISRKNQNKLYFLHLIMSIGVPQESMLGPIFFILFINDFHKAVGFSIVHHFVDWINLLLTENSLKKLNKHINRDLKLVAQWL